MKAISKILVLHKTTYSELAELEEAKTFLRNHTNLEEVSEGKFKVSDENIFGDQTIEAKYIEII